MSTPHIQTVGDVIAATISVSALLQWLPAAAAILSIIWTGMRVYDWIKKKWEAR